MDDKGKQFYDYLSSQGIEVPPSYEEFSTQMQNKETAGQFHSFVSSKGIEVPKSVDEFASVFAPIKSTAPEKKSSTGPTPGALSGLGGSLGGPSPLAASKTPPKTTFGEGALDVARTPEPKRQMPARDGSMPTLPSGGMGRGLSVPDKAVSGLGGEQTPSPLKTAATPPKQTFGEGALDEARNVEASPFEMLESIQNERVRLQEEASSRKGVFLESLVGMGGGRAAVNQLKKEADGFQQKVDETNPMFMDALNRSNKAIDNMVKDRIGKDLSKFVTTDKMGFSIADQIKVSDWASKIAMEMGLPDDGHAKRAIENNLTDKVAFYIIEPEVTKEFEKRYGAKLGELPKDVAAYVGEQFDVTKINTELESFAKQSNKLAGEEKKQNEIAAFGGVTYEQYVQGIKQNIESASQSMGAKYSSLVNENNEFIGTDAQFAEYNADAEKIKSMYSEADTELKKAYDSAMDVDASINRKYNRLISEKEEQALRAYKSYEEERNTRVKLANPLLEAKAKKAYEQALKAVSDKEEGLRGKIASAMPLSLLAASAWTSSVSGSMSRIGELTGSETLRVYGKQYEKAFNTGSPDMETMKDWLDVHKAVRSAANLGGSMTTSMIPAVIIGAATGGLGAPAWLTGTTAALASATFESMDIAGGIAERTIAETGDAAKATERVAQTFTAQRLLAPTYFLEMLPVFGKIAKGGLLKRVAIGSAVEYSTETALQEFPQQLFEDAIMNDKGVKGFFENFEPDNFNKTVEKFGSVARNTIAVAPLGGLGQARGYYSEKADEAKRKETLKKNINTAYTKAKLGDLTGVDAAQNALSLVTQKGREVAQGVVSMAYMQGEIDFETFGNLSRRVDEADAMIERVNKSYDGGDNQNKYIIASMHIRQQEHQKRADAENDPLFKSQHQKKADDAKKVIDEIFESGQPNYTRIEFSNGSFTILTNNDAKRKMSDPAFMQAFTNGDIKVEAFGKDSQKMTEALAASTASFKGDERAAIDKEIKLANELARQQSEFEAEREGYLLKREEELGIIPEIMEPTPKSVSFAINRIEKNLPTDPIQAKNASDWLYAEYKKIRELKNDPSRNPLSKKRTDELLLSIGADIEMIESHLANMDKARVSLDEEQSSELAQEEAPAAPVAKVELAPIVVSEDKAVQGVEAKRIETEAKIKRKDLFGGVGEFSTELGGSDKAAVPVSHKETNGIEFVEYAHPETGSVDVVVTGKSGNDFVGFYRIYENGKPTNKWSSKFENQSRNKEDFKTMISGVQEMLPQGHEYTEKTSISTDGLRVWGQQLSRGYELQYDENGKLKTNLVAINGDAIVNELGVPVEKGNFENIRVKSKEEFEIVKKALLPYLEKLGLGENDVRWLTGTVKINLPVLKSKEQSESNKETPKAGSVGVGGDVKQKELENKVEEVNKERQALRGEDGVVPADKMGEWNELGKKLNEAKAAAQRGSSKSSILIKKKAESETSDPTILTKEEKEEAADLIEQVIQNSKTVEEAVKKVNRLGYVFDLENANLFAIYLSDRYNSNAPQVGNNKSSFQEWVNGVQPKAVEQSLKETPSEPTKESPKEPVSESELNKKKDELKDKYGVYLPNAENFYRFLPYTGSGGRYFIQRQTENGKLTSAGAFDSLEEAQKYADKKGFDLLVESENYHYFTSKNKKLYDAELAALEKPAKPFISSFGTPVKDLGKTLEGVSQTNLDGVNVLMSEVDGNTVKLESIETPEAEREQGKAKKALQKIIDKADELGKTITLSVVPKKLEALESVEATTEALDKVLPKNDQIAVAVSALPKKGVVNYKDIKTTITTTDYERYFNNPSSLNEKARKIYEELKKGGKLRNEKILLSEDGRLLDGTHRLKARLALGQTDFEYSVPSKDFFTKPFVNAISEAYHKAKKDGSNPELVKAVETLLGATTEEGLRKLYEGFGFTPTKGIGMERKPGAKPSAKQTPSKNATQTSIGEAVKALPEKEQQKVLNNLNALKQEGKKAEIAAIKSSGMNSKQLMAAIEEINQRYAPVTGMSLGDAYDYNKKNGLNDKFVKAVDELVGGNRALQDGGLNFNSFLPSKTISGINPDLVDLSVKYKAQYGITENTPRLILSISEENGMAIADAYEQMKHDPDNPEVKASFDALITEIKQQADLLLSNGYKFELSSNKKSYESSSDMVKDVRDNKHVFVDPSSDNFGTTREFNADNVGLQDSGYKDVNGNPLTNVEVIRAVHDIFGHAKFGVQFGPIGEENAWRTHMSMFSPLAQKALTATTRGQNSWVNFNKMHRNKDGKVIKSGEPGFVKPEDKDFAEQKIGLLPDWAMDNAYGETVTIGNRKVIPVNKYIVSGEEIYEIDSAEAYHEAITSAKESRSGENIPEETRDGIQVHVNSIEDYKNIIAAGGKLLVSRDGLTGIKIEADGLIGGGFNHSDNAKKNALAPFLIAGIKLGARYTDAYDTYLPKYYARFGFAVSGRMKFNPDFAEEGWDSSILKTSPDVVFMYFNGGNRATIEHRVGKFAEYKKDSGEYFEDYDLGVAASKEKTDEKASLIPKAEVKPMVFKTWAELTKTPHQKGVEVDVPNAPEGNFISVGLQIGDSMDSSELIKESFVIANLPSDVEILRQSTLIASDGEPFMSMELSRPLSKKELLTLQERTSQLDVPQLSGKKGTMYGTQQYGAFDPTQMTLPDGVKLSDYEAQASADKKSDKKEGATNGNSVKVFAAPFYNQIVLNAEEAESVQKSPAYKKHLETIRNIADEVGLSVKSISTVIGGYTHDDTGEQAREITPVIEFNSGQDFEKVTKFAAIMGALSPEVQETTIAARIISESERETEVHTANLISIKVDNFDEALKLAQESGLDHSAYIDESKINFLDFGFGKDDDFDEKLYSFAVKLNEKGIKHEPEKTAIESRLIGATTAKEGERHNFSRKEIFDDIKREVGFGERGQQFRDAIAKAEKRNNEFIRQQEVKKERIEYGQLREKEIELQRNGKNLTAPERKRMAALAEILLPNTKETFTNAKDDYEEAKAEIEVTAKKIAEGVGFFASFDIKRAERAAVKVLRWYKGQSQWLGDGARTNIIVFNEKDIEPTIMRIKEEYNGGIVRDELKKTDLGYPKKLLEVRTSNGKLAEFQVMTPEGYLAKDGVKYFPDNQKSFAQAQLSKVREKLGWAIPDGVGHYFYEIDRDSNVPESLRNRAKSISLKYYDAFLNPNSTYSETEFRDDVSKFKKDVDNADKSEWDDGNKALSPETLNDFLASKPKAAAAKELSKKEAAMAELARAREAFRLARGKAEMGGLGSTPEFIALTKALINAGFETIKEFINEFRSMFPDEEISDEELTEAFNNEKSAGAGTGKKKRGKGKGPKKGKKKSYEARQLKEFADSQVLTDAIKATGTRYEAISWKDVEPISNSIVADIFSDPSTVNEKAKALADTIAQTTNEDYRNNDALSTLHALVAHQMIAEFARIGDVDSFQKWSKEFSDDSRHRGRFISAMQSDASDYAITNGVTKRVYDEMGEALSRTTPDGSKIQDVIDELKKKLELTEEEVKRLEGIVAAVTAAAPPQTSPSVTSQPPSPQQQKKGMDRVKSGLSKLGAAIRGTGRQMNAMIPITTEMIEAIREIALGIAESGVYQLEKIRAAVMKQIKDAFPNDKNAVDSIDAALDGILEDDAIEEAMDDAEEASFVEKLVARAKANAVTKAPKPKTAEQVLLDTLLAKVNETIKKEGKPVKLDESIRRIKEGIQEAEFGDDVWQEAMNNIAAWLETQPNISDARKQEILAQMEDSVAAFMDQPFANSDLRKALKSGTKDLGIEIKNLVKQHWTKQNAGMQSIENRLIYELGLSIPDAQRYSAAIVAEINSMFEGARKAEINRMLGLDADGNVKGKKSPVNSRVSDKIIAAINLGVMDDLRFRGMFAEKYGFTELTPKDIKMIRYFNDLINIHQGNELSQYYLKQMMDYIENLKPYDAEKFFNTTKSLMIRGMLNGMGTMMVNIPVGSQLSYMASMYPMLMSNPVAAALFRREFGAAGLGGIGIKTFGDIMMTGFDAIEGSGKKFDDRKEVRGDQVDYWLNNYDGSKMWEDVRNAKSPKEAMNAMRIAMGRSMIMTHKIANYAQAFDAIISYRATELDQFIVEYNKQAKAAGYSGIRARFDPTVGKKILDAVKAKMAYDTDTKNRIADEVDDEIAGMRARGERVGFGLKQRLIKSKMESMRDADNVKASLDRFRASVLMEAPTGFAGQAYEMIADNLSIPKKSSWMKAGGKHLALSMFGLFLRISVTSAQKSIENTPVVGLVLPGIFYDRKLLPVDPLRPNGAKEWRTVRQDNDTMRAKLMTHAAVMAIFTMAAMSMFTVDDEDDELNRKQKKLKLNPDRWIDITGYGTGKWYDSDQLGKDGKPRRDYTVSIKVNGKWHDILPARLIPHFLPFIGFLGGLRDEAELNPTDFKNMSLTEQFIKGSDDVLLASTVMSFATIPRVTESLFYAAFNKETKWEATTSVASELASIALNPAKAAIYPNLLRDFKNEYEAIKGETARTGKGVLYTIAKDLPVSGEMVGDEAHDVFGYPKTKTSRILTAVQTVPGSTILLDNFFENRIANEPRFKNPVWVLKGKYQPNLVIASYSPKSETPEDKNMMGQVYGEQMRNLWLSHEKYVKAYDFGQMTELQSIFHEEAVTLMERKVGTERVEKLQKSYDDGVKSGVSVVKLNKIKESLESWKGKMEDLEMFKFSDDPEINSKYSVKRVYDKMKDHNYDVKVGGGISLPYIPDEE